MEEEKKQIEKIEEDSDYILNKHSAAIHISGNLSFLERKMFNCLMINAMNNEEKEGFFSVPLVELKKAIGYNSNEYTDLKTAADKLLTTKLQWNVLKKDKKDRIIWKNASTFIASRGLSEEKGILTYSFSSALKQLFFRPNIYAKLNLKIQNQFSSKYSVVLWELLMEHICTGGNITKTDWIDVEDYRMLMGAEGDKYKSFKEVNRKLISKPLEEVNKVSDLKARKEFKKSGKNVVALRFDVKRKELDFTPSEDKKITQESPVTALLKNKVFSLNEAEIKTISSYLKTLSKKDFTEEDFINSLMAVKENITNGYKVNNMIAHIKAAIKEKWQSKEIKKSKEAKEIKQFDIKMLEDELAKVMKTKKDLIKKFEKYLLESFEKDFHLLTHEEKEILKKEYQNTQLSGTLQIAGLLDAPEEVDTEKLIKYFTQNEVKKKPDKVRDIFKEFEKEKNFSTGEIDSKIFELQGKLRELKGEDTFYGVFEG